MPKSFQLKLNLSWAVASPIVVAVAAADHYDLLRSDEAWGLKVATYNDFLMAAFLKLIVK